MGESEKNRLAKDVTSFRGSFFNSFAGQAPTYSVAGGAAFIISSAFASAPLAMLLTLIGVLSIIYAIYYLSKRYVHAASFYAYVSKTLGTSAGFFNGITYALFYSIIGLASVAIAFAYLTTEGLYASFNIIINPLYFLAIPVIIAFLVAYFGLKPSIRSEVVLASIEFSILIIFIVLSFIFNYSRISVVPFTLKGTFTKSLPSSISAISGGLVFAITYFMGFEVSTQISEEVKNPKRDIPIGTLFATTLMGLIYILVTYSIILNTGISYSSLNKFVSEASGTGVNPVYTLMGKYMGHIGITIFSFTVILSVFACYLATLNATARMFYGMAREGQLPKVLEKTHSKYKSPHTSLYFSTGLTALVIILTYVAAIILGYRGRIGLTYNAMQIGYAIDSLYYVISLALLSVSAIKSSKPIGKVISIIGLSILAITFYYSIVNIYYLVAIIISSVLIVIYYASGLPYRKR
ncbi:MAG: amino acid permease [Caldisphaeraceae archaeon]|nr:amino acid permease [Caldisphaeraceae archaeon]